MTSRLTAVMMALFLVSSAEGPGIAAPADAGTTIENEHLAVHVSGSGMLTVRRGTQRFVEKGTLGDFVDTAKARISTRDVEGALGGGRAIEIAHPAGRAVTLTLYEKLPFLCLETSVHNPGAGPLVIEKFTPLVARLDMGRPAEKLRALGYDGLAPADQPKTTYLSICVSDPETYSGVACGWLTHDRASGIAVSRAEGDAVIVEGRSEYGRLLVPPGETVQGETLAIGYFEDAREGLELLADTTARIYGIRVKPVPSGYMTWYHARALDEKRMPVLATWCEEHLKPYGFDFLQIDDGWQVSRRDFTTHDPKGPYPGGMKPTAAAIARRGLTAGIWVTPFGWDHKRPVFAEHQDWFVKRQDGSVYAVKWGGDCLDMSHPEARKFLHEVIDRIANKWGYKFFKLDGLWAGMAATQLYPNPAYRPDNLGDAVFHDPGVTNVEAFRRGLKVARDAAGPDTYFLGCTAAQNMRTLAGAIGLVDGIRVGIDSGRKWEKILANVKVSTSIYFLHGRVWHNDPDVLYLDDHFTLDEIRAWASWLAISGQMYMVSNWLPGVPAERVDVVKRTIPNHNLEARPVDLFEAFPARIWHLRSGDGPARRDVVALFNWDETEEKISVDLEKLGLPGGNYARFEFWTNRFQDRGRGPVEAVLPPRSCRVFSLRRADHPVLISTSRHVTQGVVDLVELEEDFDGGRGVIRGVSRVVRGEPYEMRIAAPEGDGPWTIRGVRVSEADRKAGVTIAQTTGKDGNHARVVVKSPTSREVRWRVDLVR